MRPGLLLLATLLLSGCAAPSPSGGTGADGSAAWRFTAFDGVEHGPAAPDANATVLFFMATWCTSCRAKAPVLTAAYDDHAARGVRFLSIGFDPSESEAEFAAWQGRYGHPWPHGLDQGREVQRALGVAIQSTVLVLDSDGKEIERFGYGQVTEQALGDAIGRALLE